MLRTTFPNAKAIVGRDIMLHMTSILHKLALTACTVAALAGCGSSPVYKDEAFSQESPYQLTTTQGPQQACEAAQFALLSQGYRVERAEGLTMHFQKHFQPDEDTNATIDFFISCKPRGSGATVFANAVETTYELKKTSGSTGFSVAGAGSITMPWSKGADSLVKVAGITIADNRFYQRFFDLLGTYLR